MKTKEQLQERLKLLQEQEKREVFSRGDFVAKQVKIGEVKAEIELLKWVLS